MTESLPARLAAVHQLSPFVDNSLSLEKTVSIYAITNSHRSGEPRCLTYVSSTGAAVAERLACSPLTKAHRVQSPVG
ncbi:hypothetical protein PR048_012019 [Dryococelus australis]|uniref:Uncharacterized protein n=1 Tax=Dryococelus australis TaxID=614101 RepID=A0ABQ9HN91_9NEOP|nr:hypothetical protein PR048_012019 [Dryococelus australis]